MLIGQLPLRHNAVLDVNAEKPYVSAAACESRHRTASYRATVNLTRMREITQDLADLFGLRLHISVKK
jgi:hypothetical protein